MSVETSTDTAPFHTGIAGFPSATAAAKRRRAAGPVDLTKLAKREALPLTLRQLAERYRQAHPDKAVILLTARKWLDDFGLGERLAWTITREEIQAGAKLMRSVEYGYAAGSVNRNLSILGTLYRFAIAEALCPEGFESPTMRIKREEEPARVVEPARVGEWEHIRGLARGKDPRFTLFVWLVMDTGCRRAEIDARTWREFDLDDPKGPCLILPAAITKTKKARRVYFSQETAALLRRLRPADKYRDGLVFVSPRGVGPNQYRKPWARLTARCGRPDLHVHDLRHMVAADLLKAGEGVAQVAHALGNSAKVLEKRYGHLDDATTRAMQGRRLGLDEYQPPAELPAVVEARRRVLERDAAAPTEQAREVERLRLIVADAMAALSALQQGVTA